MPQGHSSARFLALAAGVCLTHVCLTAVCSAQGQTDPAWRPVDPAKAAAAQHGPRKSAAPVASTTPSTAAASTTPSTVAPTHVPATKEPVANASVARASKAKGKKGKQQEQAEPLPRPRPLTPEQLPPTRPTVSYRDGKLSILANNSTMADVLNSVRAQTGAQFEMTGISSADRVYAKLGPGAPKDVLAALFDGSRFNFAILGSASDPGAVARVVLMPKAGGATSMSASQSTPSVQPTSRPVPAQAQPEQSDEEGQPEEAPAEEVQPEPAQVQPEQQQPQQPGQVKTPEQLLQELQQMQQQQLNQQNPQNPNAQPPQQQIPDREIPDEQPPQ